MGRSVHDLGHLCVLAVFSKITKLETDGDLLTLLHTIMYKGKGMVRGVEKFIFHVNTYPLYKGMKAFHWSFACIHKQGFIRCKGKGQGPKAQDS